MAIQTTVGAIAVDASGGMTESGPRVRPSKWFCISIDSPPQTAVHASGRWTVEAEDGERALARLLPFVSPKLWPQGVPSGLCAICAKTVLFGRQRRERILVTLQKSVQAAAHRLVLGGVGPLVREEFAILRLDRFFELMLDQSQAARPCGLAAC